MARLTKSKISHLNNAEGSANAETIISLEEKSASLEQVYLEVVEADINHSPTTINPDIKA